MQKKIAPKKRARIQTKVKGSKFIASLSPALTQEDAGVFLEKIRKEFWDATHNVYAFRIGVGNKVIEEAKDDGEPSGSSGPPILQAIQGENLTDIIIVVSRYFGGTKLGIGGLVRAYGEAAAKVIKSVPKQAHVLKARVEIATGYDFFGNLNGFLESREIEIGDVVYGNDGVKVYFWIDPEKVEGLEKQFQDLTRGNYNLRISKKAFRPA